MVWDYETCVAVATRGVELAREAGALAVLAVSVNVLAQAVALGGEFGRAALLVAEADSVTEATGARVAPYGALVLAGLQGREAEAVRADRRHDRASATAGGQGTAVQYARWASCGAPQRPRPLRGGAGRGPGGERRHARAVRLRLGGERADRGRDAGATTPSSARDALERLAEATRRRAHRLGARASRRGRRALLSEGEAAERLYREAIERLGRTRLRPELARAHLLYGEWLRRENRRVDARAQLRAAHEQFTAIGMEAFAERARSELLATGEKVRKRTVETRDELTAQERQIARLARDGLSNPEIGARLFLSPRTVEWHLRKVFAKLGIRSRRELADALPARLRARAGLSSGVGERLDDPPPERPFEVAVGVEPELLEPGGLRLLRGTPEQLEEVGQGGRKLAVGGQRHLVDVGLRARDRVVIEAREPRGDRVDLVVEPVVGDHPVDVPVLLRARSVEVVGDEQDLERPAATDQAGEPGHRAAAGDHARCRPRTGRAACSRARRTAGRRRARTRFRRRGRVRGSRRC